LKIYKNNCKIEESNPTGYNMSKKQNFYNSYDLILIKSFIYVYGNDGKSGNILKILRKSLHSVENIYISKSFSNTKNKQSCKYVSKKIIKYKNKQKKWILKVLKKGSCLIL